MANNVKLANGNSFEAEPGQTILEAARSKDIALEHSCRTGRCGVCKARVISGKTQAIKPEGSLGKEEELNGFILTCCRSASSDLELDIEDLGELGRIRIKTLPCRINRIDQVADDVMEVSLRTPPNNKLDYLPGQYIDVIGKNGLRRSYSIANAPREDGQVTLQIRKVESGQMSRYWFSEAKSNDLLRMEGPLGTFCLRETAASNLILLATGTGIAPVKAILEQLSESPGLNTFKQIYLFWGARTQQDLYWQPDFPGLLLDYTPVLSRSSDWGGAKGYVQKAVLASDLKLEESVVYASGSELMIHDAQLQLTAAGLPEKNFYSDAFVSSN